MRLRLRHIPASNAREPFFSIRNARQLFVYTVTDKCVADMCSLLVITVPPIFIISLTTLLMASFSFCKLSALARKTFLSFSKTLIVSTIVLAC